MGDVWVLYGLGMGLVGVGVGPGAGVHKVSQAVHEVGSSWSQLFGGDISHDPRAYPEVVGAVEEQR